MNGVDIYPRRGWKWGEFNAWVSKQGTDKSIQQLVAIWKALLEDGIMVDGLIGRAWAWPGVTSKTGSSGPSCGSWSGSFAERPNDS